MLNFKVLYTLLLGFIIFLSGCGEETGIEGEWKEFNYTIGSPDDPENPVEESKTKILIDNSSYDVSSNRYNLKIEWKAINQSKAPSNYAWQNKVVIDEEGRIFAPYDGQRDFGVQPLDETNILSIWYNLPQAVSIDKLHWGLYHGNLEEGLKYKIKLTPEPK